MLEHDVVVHKAKCVFKTRYVNDDQYNDVMNMFNGFVLDYDVSDGITRYSSANIELEEQSYFGVLNKCIAIEFTIQGTYFKDNIFGQPIDLYEELIPIFGDLFGAIFLTNPQFDFGSGILVFYFDSGDEFSEVLVSQPCEGLFEKNNEQLQVNRITLSDSWNWIKTIKREDSNSTSAYNALTYLLNRDYCEKILYVVCALENLFIPGEKYNVKKRLANAITKQFLDIDKTVVEEIYTRRSKVAHGEYRIRNFFDLEAVMDEGFSALELTNTSIEVLVRKFREIIESKTW